MDEQKYCICYSAYSLVVDSVDDLDMVKTILNNLDVDFKVYTRCTTLEKCWYLEKQIDEFCYKKGM